MSLKIAQEEKTGTAGAFDTAHKLSLGELQVCFIPFT